MFVLPVINLFVVELIILDYPADRTLARTLQIIVMVNNRNFVSQLEPLTVKCGFERSAYKGLSRTSLETLHVATNLN